MGKLCWKKIVLYVVGGVLCGIFMFKCGVLCRNVVSKINYLENKQAEVNLLQNNLNEFYYSYSLKQVELEDEFWGENTFKEPHLFLVVSDLNCSLCLDTFMEQVISLQDSMDVKHASILLLNTSQEILYKYKRVYKIRIPIYNAHATILDEMMGKFNTPYIFISDQNNQIKHLYSSKDALFLKQYLELMGCRYFSFAKIFLYLH